MPNAVKKGWHTVYNSEVYVENGRSKKDNSYIARSKKGVGKINSDGSVSITKRRK